VGGKEEEGARLCSVLPADRTRGSGHKLKNINCHLNTQKHAFTCEDDRALEQVSQRGCEVSIHGDVQNPKGNDPGQPGLCWSRGWYWLTSRGALQPQPSCDPLSYEISVILRNSLLLSPNYSTAVSGGVTIQISWLV